jgi:UDP-glucose 4-epimerase
VRSARITEVAAVLIGERPIEVVTTGIRPGEKIHEILVSLEESFRTAERAGYYVLQPQLPELALTEFERAMDHEYSSADSVVSGPELQALVSLADFVDPAMSGPGAPVATL